MSPKQKLYNKRLITVSLYLSACCGYKVIIWTTKNKKNQN